MSDRGAEGLGVNVADPPPAGLAAVRLRELRRVLGDRWAVGSGILLDVRDHQLHATGRARWRVDDPVADRD